MVPIVSSRTPFEAKVLAARLGAEGIVWEYRGNVDGMYPIGVVDVLVAEGDLDRARELLLVDEVEEAMSGDGAQAADSRRIEWLLGVALVLFVIVFVALRIMAI
jgi:hypothetical protein